MDIAALADLIKGVSTQGDGDAALHLLATSALELTRSRNALIARMNDADGRLELRYGAGPEWARADADISLAIGTKEGIVSYVAATGATVVSGDVEKEPRYRNLFDTTKSEIAVPIKGERDRLRAVINLESDRLDAYGDEERFISEAVAALASIVLEREEAKVREIALTQVGVALDTALTEDDLIDKVMRVAGEVLRFQACSIFLLEKETDTFVLRGSIGRLKDQVGQIRYKRGEGCTGWVCEWGETLNLDEPQKDERWRGKYVEFPADEIAHFLAVPVMSRGRCIGAIRVIRRASENPYLDNRFTESDARVLQSIAEQVGTGLENIRNVEKVIRSERMIAWGELSAKSSHMIGNRVFALKGDVNELSHVLAESDPSMQQLIELQKSLSTNLGRIEEILQDFRDFLTATQLKREPVDLNKLVEETADEVFPKRGPVDLSLELGKSLPSVAADPPKLRRAVSELIENAMNYMSTGTLRLSTGEAGEQERRMARAPAGKQYVKLMVEDMGPGVPEQDKARIFEPFFSGRVKGMGLGLSIVKGIIDAHGGGVYEAGSEGSGAKFVILLPAADRP